MDDPLSGRPESQEQRISVSVDLLKVWRWFNKRGTDDNRITNSNELAVGGSLPYTNPDVHSIGKDCLGGCDDCGCRGGEDVSGAGHGGT